MLNREVLDDLKRLVPVNGEGGTQFLASELKRQLKISNNAFISGLKRTKNIFIKLHISLTGNVKNVYNITKEGIMEDIKLSPLACLFVAALADPHKPLEEDELIMIAKSFGY